MKPVNEDRLGESLARARFALAASQPVQAQLGDLLRQLQVDNDNHDRITIRADGHVHFLRPGDIVWVQADGDYVTVHTRERSHLIRATMKAMEEQLAGRGFQRIHRSSIVNLNEIGELVSTDSGDYEVILQDRSSLKLSRTYRDALYRKMAPGSR
jgi:two-component system LytT family response regulator